MYSIGEVSTMFQLSIPTLRYYDQQGLFPNLRRTKSGIRSFDNQDVESIRIIEYLKKAGMSIKDIRIFIHWCNQGDSTLVKRRNMFMEKLDAVRNEIEELQRVQDLLKFKTWYYSRAVKEGSEDRVKNMRPEDMPGDIRAAYENSHAELPCWRA